MKDLMKICKEANYERKKNISYLIGKAGFDVDYRLDPKINEEDEKTVNKMLKVIQGGFYTYEDEEKFSKEIEKILKKYIKIYNKIVSDAEEKTQKIEKLIQSLPEILIKHDENICTLQNEIKKVIEDLQKEGVQISGAYISLKLMNEKKLKGLDIKYVESMISTILNK